MELPSGVNYGEEQGPWMSAITWLPIVQLWKRIRGGCKEFAKFTKFELEMWGRSNFGVMHGMQMSRLRSFTLSYSK